MRHRERVDELAAHPRPRRQPCVELDAVAGLQYRVLEDCRAALRAGPSAPMRSRNSTGAVRWLSPRQTSRCTSPRLYFGPSTRMPTCARSGSTSAGPSRTRARRGRTDPRRKGANRARQQDAVVAPRPPSAPRTSTVSRTARRSRRTRSSSDAVRGHARDERGLRARAPPPPTDPRAPLPPVRPPRRRSSRSSAASEYAVARDRTESSSRSTSTRSRRSTPRRSPYRSCSRSATRSQSAASPTSSDGGTRPHTSCRTRWRPSSASTSAPRRLRSTRTSAPFSRATSVHSGACAGAGLPEPLVMRSSGGLATLEEGAHAAFALLSGPAAGPGAARLAALAGFENALVRHGRHLDRCLRDRRRRGAARARAPGRRSPDPSADPRRAHRRRGRGPSSGWTRAARFAWARERGAIRGLPATGGAECTRR